MTNEETIEDKSWFLRHPGPALTVAVMIISAIQWGLNTFLEHATEPEIERINAEIRGIRKDVRAMATFELESARSNREMLQALAKAQGLSYDRPPELQDAELEVRKLKTQ